VQAGDDRCDRKEKIAAQELALERQQQERLARQPFMLWFKDPQGRLVSANASLLQDWQHFAQDAALEKLMSRACR